MKQDCLFCKIAAGDIPSVKIYETEGVLAFLDISPVEKGHTLVISKRVHSETILDTPPEVAAELVAAARLVAAAMMRAGFGGVNLVQNNFPDGGQAELYVDIVDNATRGARVRVPGSPAPTPTPTTPSAPPTPSASAPPSPRKPPEPPRREPRDVR